MDFSTYITQKEILLKKLDKLVVREWREGAANESEVLKNPQIINARKQIAKLDREFFGDLEVC